jgi:hypothetical protein
MRKWLNNDQLFIKTQKLAKRWADLKPGDLGAEEDCSIAEAPPTNRIPVRFVNH